MGLGNIDLSELEKLEKALKDLSITDYNAFKEKELKKVTMILLSKIIFRTPVGAVNGGTLRRGWTGGVDMDPAAYTATLPINKTYGTYSINLSNDVHYATFVEYGHVQEVGRFVPAIGKRLVSPWVDGRFMVRSSINELKPKYPSIVAKDLSNYLKEKLDV